ncbi:MAG: hypothetical protein IRZ13_14645 [Acetobacteraceae bacterium]|nr:hypothetical protein [Acetobacteraceae bacterium]
MDTEPPTLTRWHKLVRELKAYAGIALYLYVCIGAIQLYKAAVLEAHSIDYAPYGFAAAKALILAKFMLIGEEFRIGERRAQRSLIEAVLYEAVVFLVVLVALSAVEEVVVGLIHGRTAAQSISGIASGRWFEIAASCLLLWLILVPYLGFRQLFRQVGDVLGEDRLRRMLFGER